MRTLVLIEQVRRLAALGRLSITLHAREEMDEDGVSTDDVIRGLEAETSEMSEDYPEDSRGHSHLILVSLESGEPLHVCCAVYEETLVIITVYRPDAKRWTPDWRRRR